MKKAQSMGKNANKRMKIEAVTLMLSLTTNRNNAVSKNVEVRMRTAGRKTSERMTSLEFSEYRKVTGQTASNSGYKRTFCP